MLPDSFETSRLRLRPVAVDDAEAIFGAYAQDEEVARYLIWRPHRSLSETKGYVERCMATPADVERTYMLLGREDNLVRVRSLCASALRTDSIAAMSSHADGGGRA
jgi:RimJ/RimL family protein N-acetyltransferase